MTKFCLQALLSDFFLIQTLVLGIYFYSFVIFLITSPYMQSQVTFKYALNV